MQDQRGLAMDRIVDPVRISRRCENTDKREVALWTNEWAASEPIDPFDEMLSNPIRRNRRTLGIDVTPDALHVFDSALIETNPHVQGL
jgi:hypothetical protein